MAKPLQCWNCGASLEGIPLPISRHANCEKCFEVLHCCRMCRHYKPDLHQSCDHDRADPPVIKESANFCDYFKPANRFDAAGSRRAASAKSDLAALFGDEQGDKDSAEEPSNPAKPKNPLDDLFSD